MNRKNYNSGELHVGRESKNRFASSSLVNDTTKSSIAIIASIVALAIIACTFFAVFGEFNLSFPAFNPEDDSDNPEKPKTYIASEGGIDMSDFGLYAQNAILIRISDMSTIAHLGSDIPIYPASMTKVMTILVALDYIESLDEEYLLTPEIMAQIPQGSSVSGLAAYVGNPVTVRDLLYGVSYKSGADSVLCLVDHLGFTMQEFVELMNTKAKEIGLENTTFGGAIGMDTEYNQTTCRDVAGMMAYAMENPICVELLGGTEYRLDRLALVYKNGTLVDGVNDFDREGFDATPENIIDGYMLIAAKSGAEVKPGYCLVSYLQNDETGEKFILVTANTKYLESPYRKVRILDMQTIFNTIEP